MTARFTDKQARSLLKSGKPGRYAAGNGLYFRLSASGTAFWVVRYLIHRKRREMTLGSYPEVSLAEANAQAAQIKLNIKDGADPLAERRRAELIAIRTVDELAEDWLQDCGRRLKHDHIPRRIYEKDLSPVIGGLALGQVTPRDVRAAIAEITSSGRPTIANDALMYCKQLFRHGIKLDLLTNNPAEAFTVTDAGGVEKSRERALTLEELDLAFTAFRRHPDQFTRENYLAMALLVCLGVRKVELVAARWSEFDRKSGIWNLPKERSKNGRGIAIPLPPEAVEWLGELNIRANGSEYVFPRRRASQRFGHMSPDTLNAAVNKLFTEKKMTVDHFTIHDLRRTCRSLLASLGVPGHVAERCLNHKIKGVEGVYDRYEYLDERREALGKLANRLSPIVNRSLESTGF